jgi:hypothetical protein
MKIFRFEISFMYFILLIHFEGPFLVPSVNLKPKFPWPNKFENSWESPLTLLHQVIQLSHALRCILMAGKPE